MPQRHDGRRWRTALPIAAVLMLTITACDAGMGTEPPGTERASQEEPSPPGTSVSHMPEPLSGTSFGCFLSKATPNGEFAYTYSARPLEIPAGSRHPRNYSTVYRYRQVDENGTVTLYLNCIIPATPGALNFMHHFLKVPEGLRGQGGQAEAGGRETALGPCEPVCELDPILVPVSATTCDTYLELDWSCAETTDGGGICQEDRGVWGPILPNCETSGPGEKLGGGDDTCSDCVPVIPCESGDEVLDDPLVWKFFDKLWGMSNPDAPDQSDRVERMGWIIRTTEGYALLLDVGGTYDPCSVDPGSIPAGAVAPVHTHPWRFGEVQKSCGEESVYTMAASSDDIAWLTLNGFSVGYFLDHNGIGRYYPSEDPNVENTQREDRCGF